MTYYIKGYTNEPNSRLIIINEADWSVEIDESSIPNYNSTFGSYSIEVTSGKKLVAIVKPDGEMQTKGNVTPFMV